MSSYGPYGQPGYGQPGGPQGQPPAPPQGQPFGRPAQPPAYGQQPPPYGQQQPGYGPAPQPSWGQPPQQPGWGPRSSASAAPPRPTRPQLRPAALPVVTMDVVPGREIATVVGPVVGVVARARELAPQARTGPMTESYATMLVTSRQDAVDQVVAMAAAAGADAVVGLRFDCSEITQSLSEVAAYGTAVRLVPDPAAAAGRTASPTTPASSNPWRPA